MKKSRKDLTIPLEEVARIGLLFLDGDAFEKVLPEKCLTYHGGDDLDYNEEEFNQLKITLMKIERIRAGVAAVLWRRRPDAPENGEVLVAASTINWTPINRVGPLPKQMVRCLEEGKPTRLKHKDGSHSLFSPLLNSDAEVVGVFELHEKAS